MPSHLTQSLISGSCREHTLLSRRGLIGGSAASLALWGFVPRSASAAPNRDPRLLTIVLRGGLDGLSLAAPVGDPDYARLRGKLALQPAGASAGAGLPLDTMFVLNPSMPRLHALFQKREALVFHAIATPYRGRSHFDGQDVLESGLPGVSRSDDGWMNRALAGLPRAGSADRQGLAMGAVVPLIMRGQAPVLSWAPKAYNLPIQDSTVTRLLDLYSEADPRLAKALVEGLGLDRIATAEPAKATPPAPGQPQRPFRDFIETAEAAARFMSTPDGPRIGALSYNGWDTHANEGVVQGQLANRLGGLDAAIGAFADGMGAAWASTVVLVVTEFGRTARTNGTEGTDHGTGMCALVLGGAINGGLVITDWPGLAETQLHENRDLKPTADLRAVIKGVLADHLGLPTALLAARVFPDSAAITPNRDLIRRT
jgi:uncharacterized protein (DUF1501 family)